MGLYDTPVGGVALDRRAGQLGADSQGRAVLEVLTSRLREFARRLEQTEVALSAYLPTRVREANVC